MDEVSEGIGSVEETTATEPTVEDFGNLDGSDVEPEGFTPDIDTEPTPEPASPEAIAQGSYAAALDAIRRIVLETRPFDPQDIRFIP